MEFTSEIFLTKKYVTKEEWQCFIAAVSDYNGAFSRWKIIVIRNGNQIRFFVKTKRRMLATIKSLEAFLLKPGGYGKEPIYTGAALSLLTAGDVLNLINDCEIKGKGVLVCLEMNIRKGFGNNATARVDYYLEKDDVVKKYSAFSVAPEVLLSVDFGKNKKYSCKSPPKYFEVSKIANILCDEPDRALLSVETFPYMQREMFLGQNSFSFDKHSIVFGSSGCGKSKLISLLIDNIYRDKSLRSKYKIVVIDPHAALEYDIGGRGRVIDFKSQLDSINMFVSEDGDIVASVELMLDLFKSVMASQYNSKLERVLRHSIYVLLVGRAFSFSSMRRLVLDLEYRNALISRLRSGLPNSVIDFFLSVFNELKTKSYGEAVSPIISFVDEMEMVPVFNGESSGASLADVLRDNFLTIFSLDRTKLGNKVTKTVAGLILQRLFVMVQKCDGAEHTILIVDEVAAIENPILSRYLSEARKYNVSVILAGQYFGQISDELKKSIFANVINYFVFRVSKLDAEVLVDCLNMKLPLNDSRDARVRLLTELNDRECIARLESGGVLLPAFKGRTLDFVGVPKVRQATADDGNTAEKGLGLGGVAKANFSIDNDVDLRDILIACSTSRKALKHEG